MTDFDKAENKAEQAYLRIKQKILSLEFLPGQPLREIELSELLSISRTPVRAAIAQLISEGFVEEAGAKRNLVAGISADAFMNIYQVRAALENLCVSLAAYTWQDKSELQPLKDILQEQTRLCRQSKVDSRAFLSADREFHRALANLSRNDLLAREMLRIYDLYWRYNFYSLYVNGAVQIVQDHEAILCAIEQQDSRGAQRCMAEHLNSIKDFTLLGLAKGFSPTVELNHVQAGYSIDQAE